MERKTTRTPTLFYCCVLCSLLFSLFLLLLCTTIGTRSLCIKESNSNLQGMDKKTNRRHLNGLGSYPPRCKSKCGKCTPCKPVHVPVPPGSSEPTEYYPEAWRCKCGNKFYMP